MVKKLKAMAAKQSASGAGLFDSALADSIKASAKEIWLAGMGALLRPGSHAVRPALVFRHQIPGGGTDAEDAPVRDVGDEEIARRVETGPLQEAVDLRPRPVGVGPGCAARAAMRLRQ